MTYLGEGRICLEDLGQGETIQINYKMNFIRGSCQRFPYTLRVPSTDCVKSIASYKNFTFLKNLLFFGSLFSVMRHNGSSVLFNLNFICFGKNEPIKVHIFRLATARMKINQHPYVTRQTTSQFFFKYCISLQCHDP